MRERPPRATAVPISASLRHIHKTVSGLLARQVRHTQRMPLAVSVLHERGRLAMRDGAAVRWQAARHLSRSEQAELSILLHVPRQPRVQSHALLGQLALQSVRRPMHGAQSRPVQLSRRRSQHIRSASSSTSISSSSRHCLSSQALVIFVSTSYKIKPHLKRGKFNKKLQLNELILHHHIYFYSLIKLLISKLNSCKHILEV